MRLRSLVRRLAKPAAMVGVVGVLSLSLIVTTPSNAHAFVDTDEISKAAPRIAGAVKTVAPAAVAVATSVTPVGWLIKGGYMLGMLAFSSSDIWMPYVTGTFGQPEPSNSTAGVNMSYAKTGFTVNSLSVNGNNFTASYSYSGSSSTWYAYMGAAGACQKPDGSIGYTNTFSYGSRTNSFTATFAPTKICPDGWTLKGLIVGGAYATPLGGPLSPAFTTSGATMNSFSVLQGGSTQYEKGPTNYIKWGTMDGSTGFDPRGADVGYQGKSECIDAAGNVTWITGEIISGAAGAVKMPSCEAAGKGHGTGRNSITAFKPDGTQQPVWDSPTAPSDPSTPLCDPGRATGGCVLSVELDGKGCEAGNVECENWSELQQQNPDNTRLKCRFGPYTLPMAACNLLEQAYRAGGAIATERNTDGDPSTRDDNSPNGQPVPQPAPAPVITGTGPGTGAVPGGAGQTTPSADQQSKQCFPQGWSMLNPVEWVMKPVGCALSAAFEPKKDLQTRLAGMQGQFSNKVPVSWFGVGVEGVSGGACPADWAVNFDGHRYSLICGTEADNIIRGFRPVLGAMLVMAMLWPFIRSLFYAAIPVFKVTPS